MVDTKNYILDLLFKIVSSDSGLYVNEAFRLNHIVDKSEAMLTVHTSFNWRSLLLYSLIPFAPSQLLVCFHVLPSSFSDDFVWHLDSWLAFESGVGQPISEILL